MPQLMLQCTHTQLVKLAILLCFLLVFSNALHAQTKPTRQTIKKKNTKLQKSSPISKSWLTGQINYSRDPRFVTIASRYAKYPGLYLHRDAYKAFQKMYISAKKVGISLKILSATRSFQAQKAIWEAKWRGKRLVDGVQLNKKIPNTFLRARIILQYSSMPKTSRHHWGTDIDLNALENFYFTRGYGLAVYRWLKKNAARFGFCQVYSKKNKNNKKHPNSRLYGYEEERWHWSYIKLARRLLNAYNKKVHYHDIKNFSGANQARKLNIIQHYVNGINPRCR